MLVRSRSAGDRTIACMVDFPDVCGDNVGRQPGDAWKSQPGTASTIRLEAFRSDAAPDSTTESELRYV